MGKALKKHNKLLLVIGNFILISLLLAGFYYSFHYSPAKKIQKIYHFPKILPISEQENIEQKVIENYGITLDEVLTAQKTGKAVYFVDVQEKEEFETRYLKTAKNIRAADINYENLKKTFGLNDEEFSEALFVSYCHYGFRSSVVAENLENENVKFLLSGVKSFYDNEKGLYFDKGLLQTSSKSYLEPFIRDEHFYTELSEIKKLYSKEQVFFVDTRVQKGLDNPIGFSFRIGQLTTQEYNENIKILLEKKEKKIVFIADIFPDLFYAKLLIQRLIKEYDFSLDDFFIVFKQSKELAEKLAIEKS